MEIERNSILITPSDSLFLQSMFWRYGDATKIFSNDSGETFTTLDIVKKYPKEFLNKISEVNLRDSLNLAVNLLQAQYARYYGEDADAIKYYAIEDAFDAIATYFEEYVDEYSGNYKGKK